MEQILRAADFAKGENATASVIAALKKLKGSDGASLSFETGTYHFYPEGTEERLYSVSNNTRGRKQVVFLLDGMRNLTVDGGNSVFIFHGKAFPFVADACRGLTLKNMILDRTLAPVAELRFREVTGNGFFMEIDHKKTPYHVENGDVVFLRESWELRSSERMLPIHKIEPFGVQYLFTKHCHDQRKNLPAPICDVEAEATEGGIRFRYRPGTPSKLQMCEGERGLTPVEGGRDLDVFYLLNSENVTMRDITVRRGCGMGIIAQTSRNIEIDCFRTDSEFYQAPYSLTADALHFVNCDGTLDIHDCHIANTMDDAINVHGIYTELSFSAADTLLVSLKHHEQNGVQIYHSGDILRLVTPATLDVVAEFMVSEAAFTKNSMTEIRITGEYLSGAENARPGCLVENPDRMPDVHIRNNRFFHLPNLRISGAGKILIENNEMEFCASALTAKDLAQYWFESGRLRHLIFRGNRLKNCNALGGTAFINVGVSGFSPNAAPKIHDCVEITDNLFSMVTDQAISVSGVQTLLLKNNRTEENAELPILVDGKPFRS